MNIRTSPHVQAATEAQRPAKLWKAWVYMVVAAVLIPVFVVNLGLAAALGFEDGSVGAQLCEGLANVVTILVVALWVTRYERRSFRSVGFRGAGTAEFLGGFVGGGILLALPMLVLVPVGTYELGLSEHTTVGASALLPVLLLIPVWLVQGTAEEVVFRGYLLQRQALSSSSWATILVVSLGFGLVHLIFDPVTLLNIVLVGIFFSFLVLARGSLWLVAGLHAGWNMVQGQVLGIPVSGVPRDVSLFDYGPTDDASNLLSGGENGLEGSIVMTAIMVVACVLAYRYYLTVAATRHPEPAAVAAN